MNTAPTFPRILAVDFDGTIVQNAYPRIGALRVNVKRVLKRLRSEGFYIIVWTCRYGQYQQDAQDFLEKEGIEYDIINEHHPEVISFYKNDTRKISADIYIDDKQLGGLPDDWETIYQLIHKQYNELYTHKPNTNGSSNAAKFLRHFTQRIKNYLNRKGR